ncbi:hypothetical protein EDC04DRAFT_2605726 [Pisolithus marmoratus]|nr:hypothetical protein EDC04DRAFT_2605726 [Pisolithus marmoratus]
MTQPMVLQQLHTGVLTMEDIVDEDDCDQSTPFDAPSDPHTKDAQPSDSIQDEQVVKDARIFMMQVLIWRTDCLDNGQGKYGDVQHGDLEGGSDSDSSVVKRHCCEASLSLPGSDGDDHTTEVHSEAEGQSTSSVSAGEDSNDEQEGHGVGGCSQSHKPGHPPMEAIQKAQALGAHTTSDAQEIADEYGKCLGSIMIAAGLTTKATQAEPVWNMHQACLMQHYEEHKDEKEYPQLWVDIQKFWKESVTGTKDMSLKAMVGGDTCIQAACQAQGIFAGLQLCMQLASERQMDVMRLIDYLAMIIKYKALDAAAEIPHIPNFDLMLHVLYD